MRLSTAEDLLEQAHELNIEAEVYDNYTGRGMFGRTTAGVVVNNWADFTALVAYYTFEVGGHDADKMPVRMTDLIQELKSLRSDDMGKQIIIY